MAPARDRRTGFSRRRQYGVFAGYVLGVAGTVVALVLLVVSALNPQAFSAARMGAASVTMPLSAALASLVGTVSSIPEDVSGHFRVKAENERLRRELTAMRRVVTRARAVHWDNRRLRRLLALRDRGEQVVVTARLVSSTPSSTRRYAILDAGRWQGVLPGMPVRGPDGLVGRVTEAGPYVARVLLLGDPESIVPVRRTRDGLPAIVAGRGDGTVDVRSVNTTDVRFRPGDLFVTTGTGGLYAPNIPVARVERAGSDTVVARPVASADTLDFVTVERPFFPLPPPPISLPASPAPGAAPAPATASQSPNP